MPHTTKLLNEKSVTLALFGMRKITKMEAVVEAHFDLSHLLVDGMQCPLEDVITYFC